jgi:hypothetical protein
VERISATVVALIGADEKAVAALAGKANVALYSADPSAPRIEQATTAWEAARHAHTPYFVHDADPLAWVGQAWAARFEGTGEVGDLEVAVHDTLARWRAGAVGLPDYYLLCSPDNWPPAWRHWYLGFLGAACPLRVVVTGGYADLASALMALPAGRWWPDMDELLAGIEHVVPDQVRFPQPRRGLGPEPANDALQAPPAPRGGGSGCF